MGVEELKYLVDLAKSKGLTCKEFDSLYYECDRDYDIIRYKLENMEVKENGR